MRLTILTLAVALTFAGCSSDDDPQGPQCTPGKSETCACPSGATGAQTCLDDGTYGACQCGNQPAADGGITPDRGTPKQDKGAPEQDKGTPNTCACNITAACQDKCDCDPDCVVVAPFYCQARTSPCWDGCKDSFGACLGKCGPANGIDCWNACKASGTSYCAQQCGTHGCAGVLCWASCTSDVKTCAATCGNANTACADCQPKASARAFCKAVCDTSVYGILGCMKTCGG